MDQMCVEAFVECWCMRSRLRDFGLQAMEVQCVTTSLLSHLRTVLIHEMMAKMFPTDLRKRKRATQPMKTAY